MKPVFPLWLAGLSDRVAKSVLLLSNLREEELEQYGALVSPPLRSKQDIVRDIRAKRPPFRYSNSYGFGLGGKSMDELHVWLGIPTVKQLQGQRRAIPAAVRKAIVVLERNGYTCAPPAQVCDTSQDVS